MKKPMVLKDKSGIYSQAGFEWLCLVEGKFLACCSWLAAIELALSYWRDNEEMQR